MARFTFSRRVVFALRRIPGVFRLEGWTRHVLIPRVQLGIADLVRRVSSGTNFEWGAAKSYISAFERLKVGGPEFQGRIVMEDQPSTPLPEKSLQRMGGQRLSDRHEKPRPIFWSKHEQAHLVTTSLALLTTKKELVLESVYGTENLGIDPGNLYVGLPKPTVLKGNYTSIVSRWCPTNVVANYSHWLLDALPRLALIDEFPADTQIIVPAKLAAYQEETLRLLGLLDRVRYTGERHLVIENYYFSAPVVYIVRDSPYSVDFLRRKFLPHADEKFEGPKRFVIDRTGYTRAFKNNEEFNRFFSDKGWKVLSPDQFTFAQELKLFKEAEAFAGAVGSGFTNAIWCSPGCAVIQATPQTILEGSTEWICVHNKLRWRFLVCECGSGNVPEVDLREVEKILDELQLEGKG